MPGYEPRFEHFPSAARCEWARRWLAMQANRMLARNTIDGYSRSMEDFFGFAGKVGVSPESATTEHVAEYVRDLCTRENPAQPKTLLAQLTDVPTPAGPTPRQLQSGLVQIEPTKERRE